MKAFRDGGGGGVGGGELARARTIAELHTTAITTLREADWSLPAASDPISCAIN